MQLKSRVRSVGINITEANQSFFANHKFFEQEVLFLFDKIVIYQEILIRSQRISCRTRLGAKKLIQKKTC